MNRVVVVVGFSFGVDDVVVVVFVFVVVDVENGCSWSSSE